MAERIVYSQSESVCLSVCLCANLVAQKPLYVDALIPLITDNPVPGHPLE